MFPRCQLNKSIMPDQHFIFQELLAEWLNDLLRRKKETEGRGFMKDLAERAEMHPRRITGLARNNFRWYCEDVWKLSNAFGVRLSELVFRLEQQTKMRTKTFS